MVANLMFYFFNDKTKRLFIGDAKNAKNEKPSNEKTVKRIDKYIQKFAKLLKTPRVDGGTIAIATNDAQAAEEWVVTLQELCIKAGINGTNSVQPKFTVEKFQKDTWITSW